MSAIEALIEKYEKLADQLLGTMRTCPRFDHQVYDMTYAKHELCLKIVEDLKLLHNGSSDHKCDGWVKGLPCPHIPCQHNEAFISPRWVTVDLETNYRSTYKRVNQNGVWWWELIGNEHQ